MKPRRRVGVLLLSGLCLSLISLGWWSPQVVRAEEGKYLGPEVLVASLDARTLYVLQADARRIDVVDLAGGKPSGGVAVPAEPTGMAIDRQGSKLYVTWRAAKQDLRH